MADDLTTVWAVWARRSVSVVCRPVVNGLQDLLARGRQDIEQHQEVLLAEDRQPGERGQPGKGARLVTQAPNRTG